MKIIIGIAVIIILGLISFAIVHSINHPCIKSHQVQVHHAAYTSYETHYITSHHSIEIPVYHAASISDETVCDQYK